MVRIYSNFCISCVIFERLHFTSNILRCGGIFIYILSEKVSPTSDRGKILKSVNKWQSYCQNSTPPFLRHSVLFIMNTFIRHKAVKNRQYVKTDRHTETDRR